MLRSRFLLPGETMTLQEAQYERLVARAEQEGAWAQLVYFLFASDAKDRLEACVKRIPLHDIEATLTWRLISQADTPGALCDMLNPINEALTPWLANALAKRLIHHGCIKETLALAKICLQRDTYDTRVLNLLSNHLACHGDNALAREIVERSLTRNPFQEDMVRLRQKIEAQISSPADVFLGLAPKPCSVAFYIPVYNVEPYLRSAIEGILSQSHPIDALLVVNDGTRDDSIAIAREYPVTILEHPENRGLAAARNTAFRNTTCDLIASVDTDACPDPDWLRHAVMTFENAPSSLAAVGGMLIEAYTDTVPDAWRAAHLAQHWGCARQYPSPLLFGANTVFQREALVSVGGYDERFRTNTEDADMDRRLRAQGYDVAYEPAMKAHHMRRDTVSSLLHTRWNYEFWYREMSGLFADAPSLIARIPELLDAVLVLLAEDIRLGQKTFLYLDVLLFFYDVIRAAHYCVAQQRCNVQEGRTLQDSILHYIPERLIARFREDLNAYLLEEVVETSPLPGWPKVAANIEPKLNAVFSTLAST